MYAIRSYYAQLADIEKGLHGDQIGAGRHESLHLLGKNLDHLVEPGISDRLEETPGRTDRSGHEAIGADGLASVLHRPGIDLLDPLGQPVMGQLRSAATVV